MPAKRDAKGRFVKKGAKARKTASETMSAARRAAFLKRFMETGNETAAAAAADVARTTPYAWRERHPDFAKEWDAAKEVLADNIEGALYDRAVHGVVKYHFHKGQLVGGWMLDGQIVAEGTGGAEFVPFTWREFDTTAAIFLLKALRPDKYRERFTIDVNVLTAEAERLAEELGLDKGEILAEAERFLKEQRV